MTSKQYASILDELISEAGEENLDKILKAFVGLLKKNNDLRLGEKIIEKFEDYQKEKEGIRKIEVTAVKPLAEEIKNELKQLGEVKEKKDPSLIGGMRVRIGDTLVDGSMKSRIESLRGKLSS